MEEYNDTLGRIQQTAFSALPEEEQPAHVGVESKDCVTEMLHYIYQ